MYIYQRHVVYIYHLLFPFAFCHTIPPPPLSERCPLLSLPLSFSASTALSSPLSPLLHPFICLSVFSSFDCLCSPLCCLYYEFVCVFVCVCVCV